MNQDGSTNPVTRRRLRISFDIDVEYQQLPIDEMDQEKVDLRQNLLDRDDLLEKMLVNKGLFLLEYYLGQMIAKGGIQGYDADQLLGIAAKSLPKEKIIEMLSAEVGGWDYYDPILYQALKGEVKAYQAEDLEQHKLIDLNLKESFLIQKEAISRYVVAETNTETVIVLAATYYNDLEQGGLNKAMNLIDEAVEAARKLSHPIGLLYCIIYGGTEEIINKAQDIVREYCQREHPNVPLDFSWIMINCYSDFKAMPKK